MAPPVVGDTLNPTATSLYNPDWPYSETIPDLFSQFQPANARPWSRRTLALGRVFDLTWNRRSQAVADYLRQFEAKTRFGRFVFYDIPRDRYFSGRFAAPPAINPVGNQQVNIKAQFVEMMGVDLPAWPSNWDRDAIFLEERDIDTNDLLKKTGTWTLDATAGHHGSGGGAARAYRSNTPGEYCEWLYFGYGFRLWSMKDSMLGKVKISLDGGLLETVDLYSAAPVASAAVGPSGTLATNINLGIHRVKIEVDATKNAASSDYRIYADAIEVMQ